MDPPTPSPHQPPHLLPQSPSQNTGVAGSLKLVLKLPKASYEQAVAKANQKRAKHSVDASYVPDQHSTPPPTPLSLVPGFPPPEHPTATPTTPIRYATPPNVFFPYTDSTVAEFTTPPRKAGKKRKSIDSAHAHDHSLLPTEGASVATPSPTTTKKRTIRRDSSGLTSPSTPPTPSILNTPTNPHKPRKPMSARARKIEAKQQLAIDEGSYMRMMELMEMEEDINGLEAEIKKLEESKLDMRKEFSFLASVPIQQPPRVIEEEQPIHVGNGSLERLHDTEMHANTHSGYPMGNGKSGENGKVGYFNGVYGNRDYDPQRYVHYSSPGSSQNARPPTFTVKIAPPTPIYQPPQGQGLSPFPVNNPTTSPYHHDTRSTFPFGTLTDRLSFYSSNSFLQSDETEIHGYRPSPARPILPYHSPYNSYHSPLSTMASPPISPPPTSPPTSPPLTPVNPSYSPAPFAPNTNATYTPRSLPTQLHSSDTAAYPPPTRPLGLPSTPSHLKPHAASMKHAPMTPVIVQPKHTTKSTPPLPNPSPTGKPIPSPLKLYPHQPPSSTTVPPTIPSSTASIIKPAASIPKPSPKAQAQTPILPPQTLKIHAHPQPSPQSIKPSASTPPKPTSTSAKNPPTQALKPTAVSPTTVVPTPNSSTLSSPAPLKPSKPLKPTIPTPTTPTPASAPPTSTT